VPVRDQSAHITYCGMFYGQDGKGQPYPEFISVDALLSIIAGLPPGTTELGCHPALFDDVPGAYRAERLIEAEVLCDPRVRAALNRHSVSLRSFSAAFRHI
jgi:predicted glycoside hydrolase/deacetylase ChbG (UPF0249 family)